MRMMLFSLTSEYYTKRHAIQAITDCRGHSLRTELNFDNDRQMDDVIDERKAFGTLKAWRKKQWKTTDFSNWILRGASNAELAPETAFSELFRWAKTASPRSPIPKNA
jgi:hypothetical protein